jgi:catechol 2,3-dioxygenase-like lactoylglutathione lyase family enzyme
MTVVLYTTVGVSDFDRSVRFYDAVFGVLGVARSTDSDWAIGWAGWGPNYDDGVSFWICRPFDGRAASPGNGAMIALHAANEAQVQAFHTAALAHGGSDEGAPGLRPHYGAGFFAAYVRDPDGNKLACVFHRHGLTKAPA